ncbi:MAG: hypothetical protein ACXVHC_01605, partial [Frankiaceae bacterium]
MVLLCVGTSWQGPGVGPGSAVSAAAIRTAPTERAASPVGRRVRPVAVISVLQGSVALGVPTPFTDHDGDKEPRDNADAQQESVHRPRG